jgi:hypothetical protein
MSIVLRRRGLAAVAASCAVLLGNSSAALGQTVTELKPVAAVLNTVTPALTAEPAPAPANVRKTLDQLVDEHRVGPDLDSEAKCVATAVYFESMGEPLQGQLAVARVVLNRAASGQYPTSWCGVVKQKAQFSFVRGGRFPRIDTGSEAWAKAQAITRIAIKNAADSLPLDVLWYHADYVAPKWRKNLNRVDKIGAHIFYRS